MAESFFVERDGLFEPSELTRGPWDPGAQHAGPPAALIGRALEGCDGAEGTQIGRVTLEILRPVPLEPLEVSAEIVRPGRSVQLLEATLRGGGQDLVRARAWRIATTRSMQEISGASSGEGPLGYPPPAGPDRGEAKPFFPTGEQVGYHTAMEYRFLEGGFLELGPAKVWMRMRHPLLPDEEPTPLQRVLVAADSGNGVSATLDYHRYVFINTDLTVHLMRMPTGEWVLLDAVTYPEPNGVGLADTALFDERGRIGRASQTLLVRER
jgi:acyl-Coa thioesterase superfamily protein/acyl-CoA thioesterase superfamily protein